MCIRDRIDRGPLECPNLIGKILNVKNDIYQIGTKSGIIKTWFARCDFPRCVKIPEVIPEKYMSVHEAVTNKSKFGARSLAAKSVLCQTKKSVCKKSYQLCS